jgi:hypothetical protein
MATKKKRWQDTPLDEWNASSVISYLYDRHDELYGIKYTTRNRAMEAGMVRQMLNEDGAEVTKRFIDACYSDYKPTVQYPGLSFSFMRSYMYGRIMPRVLAEKARERAYEASEDDTNIDNADWI